MVANSLKDDRQGRATLVKFEPNEIPKVRNDHEKEILSQPGLVV